MPVQPKNQDGLPIPFISRRTPILLMLRSLLALFLIEVVYVGFRVAGSGLDLNSSSVGFFLLFAAAQLVALAVITLHWYFDTYEIHHDDLHHNSGVLFRKERTYPYSNIQTITCRQSPLGRIYHYGDVSIFIPTLGRELTFKEVPHPHHFIRTIRDIMPYPERSRFILHG